MSLDDSGNLGLGVTPSNALDVQKAGTAAATTDLLELTNSGNAASMTNTGTGILFNQFYYDATTPAVADAGRIAVKTEGNWTSTGSTQDAYMTFETALDGTVAERARITSGGVLDLATGAGAVGQIQFPATQVASSNANTLDDYEEGEANVTYSPESSGTITVDTNNDRIAYTKIGRQVTITGQVNISAVSSPAGGYVHVNGLPFASADLTESAGRIGGAVTFYDDSTNSYTARGVLMVEGGTQARLYIDASTVAASDGFVFSFSYFTT
jgi:hypothetical protein